MPTSRTVIPACSGYFTGTWLQCQMIHRSMGISYALSADLSHWSRRSGTNKILGRLERGYGFKVDILASSHTHVKLILVYRVWLLLIVFWTCLAVWTLFRGPFAGYPISTNKQGLVKLFHVGQEIVLCITVGFDKYCISCFQAMWYPGNNKVSSIWPTNSDNDDSSLKSWSQLHC